ncbi:MAG: hypothetical protein IPL46_22890 [Saprospiraceae bacterium]|nr:hypothetical protein [Saprospiraceae bacterium]
MKNILYSIFILSLVISSGCVDDDRLFSLDDFPKGALPNFSQGANDDGFIGLGKAANFNMEIAVDFSNNLTQSADGKTPGSGRTTTNLEFADVSSLDIEVMWTDASSGNSYTGVVGSTSSWPAVLSFSGMDIVNAITELTSPDSLKLGDIITVAGGVRFADGRHSPAFVPNASGQPVLAYSPSYFNHPGYTALLRYSVNCVSELGVEVEYEVLEAVDVYGGPTPLTSGTFTWVTNANGNYTWTSYSFGTYQNAYGCCEQAAGSALRITDLCDDLSISAADGYGCAWDLIVDEVSGSVLTVTLSGANGGCFDHVTVKMTRTDGLDWPALY